MVVNLWETEPQWSDGVVLSTLLVEWEGAKFFTIGSRSGKIDDSIAVMAENFDLRRVRPLKNGRLRKISDFLCCDSMPAPLLVIDGGEFATNYSGADRAYGPVIESLKDWEWTISGNSHSLFTELKELLLQDCQAADCDSGVG